MWPRLIAQLVELLPHVARLLPLADHYLSARSAADAGNDPSQQAALSELTEAVRSELTAVTEAQAQIHSRIDSQLEAQSAQIARLTVQLELTSTRLQRLGIWLVASGVLCVLLLCAILILLLHNGMHHVG